MISIDDFICKFMIDPIFKKICFIQPNTVTIINLFLMIPIFLNFKNNGSMKTLLLLSFLNRYLDCLDGYIARNCNKKTKFGATLDIVCDVTLSSSILFFVLVNVFIQNKKLNTSRILLMIIFILIQLYSLYIVYLELTTSSYLDQLYKNKTLSNKITIFYRNNATPFGLFLVYILKKFNTSE